MAEASSRPRSAPTPTTTATLKSPASAFERAAAYDRADRDRLLSIAALMAVAQDDVQGAEADLAQVASADGLFPRLARAAIADHARPASADDASEVNQVSPGCGSG